MVLPHVKRILMDPNMLGVLVMAVFITATVLVAWVQGKRERELRASWAAMAGALGLTYEEKDEVGALAGEVEGVPVRVYVDQEDILGRGERRLVLYVMRAEVPESLPPGFVAAPRKWTSWMDRMSAPNVFTVGEPTVDEAYIFQSYKTELGPKLLQDAEVLRTLAELVDPEGASFVLDNRVGLAYRKHTPLQDVDKVRRNLMLLVRAARALARAQARLRFAA